MATQTNSIAHTRTLLQIEPGIQIREPEPKRAGERLSKGLNIYGLGAAPRLASYANAGHARVGGALTLWAIRQPAVRGGVFGPSSQAFLWLFCFLSERMPCCTPQESIPLWASA